jgi:hypothetical protein
MPLRTRRTLAALFGLPALVTAGFSGASPAAAPQQPFPYDPLCRWGRLSDGKGYVIRCLSREEAVKLGAPGGPAPSAPATTPPPDAPGKAPEAPAPTVRYEVVLGPVSARAGAFPQAVQSLSKGQEKFDACVSDHGGMTASEGKVEVRFLVSGRGRAEGAVVKKHSGVSKAAASCIADVVDRRFVGYPAEEMLEATLLVTVKKRTP